jgi:hypothetical protein
MARRVMAIRDEDNSKVLTIYTALDLGRRRWTVGMLLPGDRDARLFQIAGGDREALSELIRRQRQTVGDPGVRVVSCYEAGRDGFWLHRWLADQGIDNRVLDPASLEVPRRRRRVKTDRVDTLGLLRGGNRYVRPIATAPHLDSTGPGHPIQNAEMTVNGHSRPQSRFARGRWVRWVMRMTTWPSVHLLQRKHCRAASSASDRTHDGVRGMKTKNRFACRPRPNRFSSAGLRAIGCR